MLCIVETKAITHRLYASPPVKKSKSLLTSKLSRKKAIHFSGDGEKDSQLILIRKQL